VAVLVAATAAGIGVSLVTAPPAPSATAGTPARLWPGPGSTVPVAPASDPAASAARVAAQQLLSLLATAADWTASASPPAPALAQPVTTQGTSNLVDAHRLWTVPGPWEATLAWVSAHPPPDAAVAGTGSTGHYGVLTEAFVTFAFPAAPPLQSRQLLVAVAPLPDGGTGVRTDAQVVWNPTRPAAEAVPGGADAVTAWVFRGTDDAATFSPPASWPPDAGPAAQVLASTTFTAPAVVRLLAHLVDSLPTAVPGTRSCPDDQGTAPQLDLRFTGPGVPVVLVHDDTNGCGGVSFAVGGTEQLPLTDDGLFHRVDQLLGLDLPGIDDPG
jgi:hypothetical protein